MYYLCKKYYKPIIVQYYMANYVINSWVPRLTLLDFQIGLMNKPLEWNSLVCRGLCVHIFKDTILLHT